MADRNLGSQRCRTLAESRFTLRPSALRLSISLHEDQKRLKTYCFQWCTPVNRSIAFTAMLCAVSAGTIYLLVRYSSHQDPCKIGEARRMLKSRCAVLVILTMASGRVWIRAADIHSPYVFTIKIFIVMCWLEEVLTALVYVELFHPVQRHFFWLASTLLYLGLKCEHFWIILRRLVSLQASSGALLPIGRILGFKGIETFRPLWGTLVSTTLLLAIAIILAAWSSLRGFYTDPCAHEAEVDDAFASVIRLAVSASLFFEVMVVAMVRRPLHLLWANCRRYHGSGSLEMTVTQAEFDWAFKLVAIQLGAVCLGLIMSVLIIVSFVYDYQETERNLLWEIISNAQSMDMTTIMTQTMILSGILLGSPPQRTDERSSAVTDSWLASFQKDSRLGVIQRCSDPGKRQTAATAAPEIELTVRPGSRQPGACHEGLPLTEEFEVTACESGPSDDPAWQLVVEDLALRGVTLAALLEFYASLWQPGGDTSSFDPQVSTTEDVVRGAIIPRSKKSCAALALVMMRGERRLPDCMVTHSWQNLFMHLVSAIVAHALGLPTYLVITRYLQNQDQIPRLVAKLRQEGVLERCYWVCALSVNQHAGICNYVPSGRHPPCDCGLTKQTQGILCEMNKFDDMMQYIASRKPGFTQVVVVDEDFKLFTRLWCLAELVQAHRSELTQSVKLHSSRSRKRHLKSLQRLRIQEAQVSEPKDRDRILRKVDEHTGQEAFNAELRKLVFGLDKAWLNAEEQADALGTILRRLGCGSRSMVAS